MRLNAQQKMALQEGQPVTVVVEKTECILIRKDVYERVKQLVYDSSEWTEGEIRAPASRVFDEANSVGPISSSG